MRFAVVRFGGSNCDLDTVYVLEDVIGVGPIWSGTGTGCGGDTTRSCFPEDSPTAITSGQGQSQPGLQ